MQLETDSAFPSSLSDTVQDAPDSRLMMIDAQADYSRFVQRIRRRYGYELGLLSPGVPNAQSIREVISKLQDAGNALPVALRIARQLVLERLVVMDVEHHVPLTDVTHTMTDLAEVMMDVALGQAHEELDAQYGAPLCADGSRCAFWVIGMGKLGGRELNVSSDIDLVYVYEEDGHTAGIESDPKYTQRSNHEYFAYLAKRLYALIGETTEHGFVFRMDLALRPNGESGPPAVSLPMLKTYFHMQGREWERFAWMKGRVIASLGDPLQSKESKLWEIVQPFVFRRYLDYSLLDALRQTHQKIRQHAVQRAAGRPERANDVKLSRGGIREIEFIVQLFQVIRGGQYPEIRTRSTLQALDRLRDAGLLSAERASQLQQAYIFLRRLEHRIQYLDDQQTHILPERDDDLCWIASSMDMVVGQEHDMGCFAGLFSVLGQSRECIAAEFDDLLQLNDQMVDGVCASGNCSAPAAMLGEEAFEAMLPPALQERVHNWASSSRMRDLKDSTKNNLTYLILRTAQWLVDGMITETAALRFIDWLDTILRRESYQVLLLERPLIHQRVLRLQGMARWAAQYLARYPGVIDELASAKVYKERFDGEAYELELQIRRQALQESGEEDEEALLNMLRRAHHAELFRTLTRDVEGYLTVEQVADDLSLLADITLKISLNWCWEFLSKRHQAHPNLAVIAYGKLGGKELGYGSDLDIVFIYDDEHERANEIYGAYARKLIQWLTIKTAEGDLFEIDTALRPNGNSGLLVTSVESFESYQLGRGSNTAWTWEHQALTRARCVVGSPELISRFDVVRHQVLSARRDAVALREEILKMREKVRQAHPVRGGKIDVKHSAGGMLDIEFCVQYLILAYACDYPQLEDDVGNIALLLRAEQAGLLSVPFGQQASDSYRLLRQIQHRSRLDDASVLSDEQLHAACEAGVRLWHQVFEGGHNANLSHDI
ncbi:bifunctional [glutamate--ammonia ligase]-adenylyl-L-tyrosine phosphorylase/[glutamate--ammonia-ligase] adenylyltransferase [Saezia sanguinis]|uniref:bifunctional [glutamate--ammonia ligase]-adenylyl-L-tyrosine phosphorylase/[glutamate--ammonia-ligase] adenylyltransferase n=1 Tax=Saezia sanguinis TaxID=1965230 RepID=UPI003072D548